MTPEVRHTDDCPGGELVRQVGRLGDELVRCKACHRFAVVSPGADEASPTPLSGSGPTMPKRSDGARRGGWPTHRHRQRLRRRRNPGGPR